MDKVKTLSLSGRRVLTRCTVWAATTKDKDYIRMVGLKHVVNNTEHRKELIAGNLSEFMTSGTTLAKLWCI